MLKKIFLLFLFLAIPGIFYTQTEYIGRSEIEQLSWGGTTHGWHQLYFMKNTTTERGAMGSYSIRLADNSPVEDEQTDLLLHFDEAKKSSIRFESARYEPDLIRIFPSREVKKFGNGSAGFLHFDNTVRIRPLVGSIFSDREKVPSFTIDFFLHPMSVHNGASVFSWHAPVVDLVGGFTGIKAYFQNGRLHWLCERVFSDREGRTRDILIAEREKVTLGEWHHHALSYDAMSGLMVLYRDGKVNNLQWLTEGGKEGGTLFHGSFSPHLVMPLSVGENYYGYIDEFRISRGKPDFPVGDFRGSGEVKSEVLTLKSRGTRPVKFFWKSAEQKGTAVRVYYRQSDIYFPPYAEREESVPVREDFKNVYLETPPWIPVKNDQELSGDLKGGRYLQWKAELYGTEGLYTPYLHEFRIMLELDPPPSAPILLRAIPLNGGVRLLWVKNKESDILGYNIYYGISSGYYFGKGADGGDSPFFTESVSSLDLMGLTNEEVYFFSITAVDEAEQESGFSAEMIARPSSVYE